MKLKGWANFPVIEGNEYYPTNVEEAAQVISAVPSCIARGNGRSYGDAGLSKNVVSSLQLNEISHIDVNTETLDCGAGILIADVLKLCVPKGFTLPVIPGTKFVSIGGAIAADIHGKNHEKQGSFANHVEFFEIMLSSGKVQSCSPNSNSALFWNTFGAMGLTGFILKARLKLERIETAYITQETIKTSNIAETIHLFEESREYEYKVAWLDTGQEGVQMGRSLFTRANKISEANLVTSGKSFDPLSLRERFKLPAPSFLPSFTFNSKSLKVFNALYFRKQRVKRKRSVVGFDSFFFPLDKLKNWNKLYGPNGFIQYQVVVPGDFAALAFGELFRKVRASKAICSLAVLKRFGDSNLNSPLSFPMPGYSIALDFKRNDAALELCQLMDDIVLNYQGRAYLAKDARMNSSTFLQSYPRVDELKTVIKKNNKIVKFESLLSSRLGITP